MSFNFLKKKNINLKLLFIFIVMFGITGVVYVNRTVGADTPTYIKIFESCLSTDRSFWGIEPGFWALNRLVRFVTPNYKALFFLIGAAAAGSFRWSAASWQWLYPWRVECQSRIDGIVTTIIETEGRVSPWNRSRSHTSPSSRCSSCAPRSSRCRRRPSPAPTR